MSSQEICDLCNGAGGDNQHAVCGKCKGSGGIQGSKNVNNRDLEYDRQGQQELREQLAYAEHVIEQRNMEIEELQRRLAHYEKNRPDALLREARRRAAEKAKQPLVKEQILLGKKDRKPIVENELQTLEREALFAVNGVL